MDEQLKPCPFCSGSKTTVNTKAKGYFLKRANARAGKDTSNYLVRCTKCGCKGPLSQSEAEAVSAWNQRALPIPDNVGHLLAALEDAADRGFGIASVALCRRAIAMIRDWQ